MENIYFNNLRVKYLKHYLNGQIKILKKMKKNYLQSGGNPKEVVTPERSRIRIPFLASFTQDLPNMIFTYIELYERIENILKILVCISKKYDKTGKMTQTLLYINNLLGFIRVYIALQRSVINITKGLWNDQLVKKINSVDTRMQAPSETDPDYEMFKKWMDKYHKERSKISEPNNDLPNVPVTSHGGGEAPTSIPAPNAVSDAEQVEAARELAAIAKVTHDLVEASKDAVMDATKTLDIVWQEKGNPIDKVNDAISDINTAALDAVGTAPPLALIAGPVKLLDKSTKISSDLIDVLDSVTTAAEKILEEQVIVESDGKCKVPILDLIIQLKNLSQRSPHIAELIGAAAIDVGDRVIDSQAPNHENLNMLQSSEPHARIAAQIALNSAENQLSDEVIKTMADDKEKGIQAYRETQGSASMQNSPAGGSKKKSLKKRKRKKRTKKKTLKNNKFKNKK